jgi:hypothetical protein
MSFDAARLPNSSRTPTGLQKHLDAQRTRVAETEKKKRRGNPAWVKGVSGNPKGQPYRTVIRRRLDKLLMEHFDKHVAMLLEPIARVFFNDENGELLAQARAGDSFAREILLQGTIAPKPTRRPILVHDDGYNADEER